jgi:hypothetical protein
MVLMEPREIIARALCTLVGIDPNGEVKDHVSGATSPTWTLWGREADAVLLALSQSGHMVMPTDLRKKRK